jgi:hypothetical protein
LKNVISNEKIVSEITKDNTKETSIVKGQFPKKNSSKKGISCIMGIRLGPKFSDRIADMAHAKTV